MISDLGSSRKHESSGALPEEGEGSVLANDTTAVTMTSEMGTQSEARRSATIAADQTS